jgi:hypothetical protein
MVKVCDTVTLDEVLAAAAVRAASLVPETSGYLVLAIGDATARLPFRVEDAAVTLTTEGSVVVARGARVVPPAESARVLRDMLARLLARSVGTMPGLAAAARPRDAERGSEAVIAELEAALVPVNRAAARRALARLARETLRAKEMGKLRRRPATLPPPVEAAPPPRVEPVLAARIETPPPARVQTPPPPRMHAPPPLRMQTPPPPRMQTPPPPRAQTPAPATPIVCVEVLRVIEVAGFGTAQPSVVTAAPPPVHEERHARQEVEVTTNVDWLDQPRRAAPTVAETGVEAAAVVLAGGTPDPLDAAELDAAELEADQVDVDELDAGWPEPSVPLLLRPAWRTPPPPVASEEEIEIDVCFTESPPPSALVEPTVATPSTVQLAVRVRPSPSEAVFAAPPPPPPPPPRPLPVDVVVWVTSPTPPPLQPAPTPWSAPPVVAVSSLTPEAPPHATPSGAAGRVFVSPSTPSPLAASLLAGTASPVRAVMPASPTPTMVGTAWSELELDAAVSAPRPPVVVTDEEPCEPPTASAPPVATVATIEAPRPVWQGTHAPRGADRRSTLRRTDDVDEALGEAPRPVLVPRQARLDPAPRSNVEDLLGSFAASSLSDERAVRAVAAGLKSLAGLEPTPPPLGTQSSAAEPTPAPPQVQRAPAPPSPVAPERSSHPRGIAVPLVVLVLALVTSSILWAYPDLIASAEPAAHAGPRR